MIVFISLKVKGSFLKSCNRWVRQRIYCGSRVFLVLVFLGSVALAASPPSVDNWWPIFVEESDPHTGEQRRIDIGGPFFSRTNAEKSRVWTFRPFWTRFSSLDNSEEQMHILYPFYNYYRDPTGVRWDIFSLIRSRKDEHPSDLSESVFRVFPFYFSLQSSDPEKSYRGLFPIWGSLGNTLGYDRISWKLFPLYSKWERHDEVTWGTPWPFIRFREGGGSHGFQLWPLFGQMWRPGEYDQRFFLWPLIYYHKEHPWQERAREKWGFLPFYARVSGEGLISETWLWPFFGYTRQKSPRYSENRYLWPIWVVGRSEEKNMDRWLPFYLRVQRPADNYERRWWLWPFFRKESYQQEGLDIVKHQFLYFLYWSMKQSRQGHPEGSSVRKRHLWPLFSYWDNAQGRQQFQLFSPFEVFFPQDKVIREVYSPFFAIYRYEEREPGYSSHNFLFKLITYDKTPEMRRLTIGPLLTAESKGFEILHGLLGADFREKKFKLLWFEF